MISLLICQACAKNETPAAPGPAFALTMGFTRIPGAGLDAFKVSVQLTRDGASLDGAILTLTIPKGSASSVAEVGNGLYEFTVTPSATGEYPITVAHESASLTRTALVFTDVHSDFDQPMAVPGDLFNTAGVEDGIASTLDGSYLFTHYGPGYFATFAAYAGTSDLAHSFVKNTIGPYAAPQRPDFFTGRISSGVITHSAPVAGLTNFFSPPYLFYGFKRQADGTYAEPFMLGIDDMESANFTPLGMSFKLLGDGTATMLFAFDDPYDGPDTSYDIYTTTITLGQKNFFGKYTYPNTLVSFGGTKLGFSDHSGIQGNPHLHLDGSGNVVSVWVDSENGTENLTAYRLTGTFPGGAWAKDDLPSKINTGDKEYQPFFDNTALYFTRDATLVRNTYVGGSYANDASWNVTENIITGDSSLVNGTLYAAGEPTIATIDGKRYLYFVYAVVRDSSGTYDDLDFNGGLVPLK